MKKVVNIAIGGIVFSIEEDAYATLSTYLETIRGHFQAADAQGEIVDDIELGIAEKFSKKSKGSVIRSTDVEAIISEMGTIADFKEMDEGAVDATAAESDEKPRKKLYRNVDDQIIAGVASGIASYFGIDPVFVRLTFVIAIFLNGVGILAYLVLWLVMPAAETLSQKLEMKGEPVTLHEFEKMVKDKIPDDAAERTSAVTRFLKIPFEILGGILRFIGRVLRNIGPIARMIIGAVVILVSASAVVGFSIALTGLHFSINSGIFELPVREFLDGSTYFGALASLYALALIPAAVGVLLGAALLKMVSKYTGVIIGALAVVWLVALFSVGHTVSSSVPEYKAYFDNMATVEHIHELEAFTDVSVFSGDNVTIQEGDTYEIVVSGKEASVARRTFEVHGGELVINDEQHSVCIGCFNRPVDIVVTTPTLEAINASHGAKVTAAQFEAETFSVILRHSADLELDIVADKLVADIAHSSELVLEGLVDELTVEAVYSSHIDTSNLENEKTSMELRHSSSADIGITEVLNVTTRYSSSARYDGDPQLTQDTSNSSSFKKKF
ncbi:DUF2807 domain-containing protein [Candidatus Kaiserbacteria bacterium]|nr:MAG: DUF2807 domain-containing protein [Candidatus Kaiserbacteria bacterium]